AVAPPTATASSQPAPGRRRTQRSRGARTSVGDHPLPPGERPDTLVGAEPAQELVEILELLGAQPGECRLDRRHGPQQVRVALLPASWLIEDRNFGIQPAATDSRSGPDRRSFWPLADSRVDGR